MDLDRFIPNRSAMDFDFARYILAGGKKVDELSSDYQRVLANALGMTRTRILEFKPPAPVKLFPRNSLPEYNSPKPKPKPKLKPPRQFPSGPAKTMDAPDIEDDVFLNILDWGNTNVLAMAVSNSVYLWNACDGSVTHVVTFDDEDGPVTSVSWASDGQHIAVGLNNSCVQLWDSSCLKRLRTFRGGHRKRVAALAWNKNLLTSGGRDGKIIDNDVRVKSHIVGSYMGHQGEVCGLKWSPSGLRLASGGKGESVFIWDRSTASSTSKSPGGSCRWLHKLEGHNSVVKALAWCPFQDHVLASGGFCIKLWNADTGMCLKSLDTDSQVCGLVWNKNGERELLSAHGFMKNELRLWHYPSMERMAWVCAHRDSVLYMTQSPNGCSVATASPDETLKIWNAFGTPRTPLPFSDCHFIR